ncbi:hypothetical protein [Nonomuraea composti]|uniref:hypothetical protein n=1 Tax=Nonomuraea composti TaxID=2720023 RepID=UPI00197CE0A6|nr:hypothetical protein [Nonomuraea sp. FMUSA5-5]
MIRTENVRRTCTGAEFASLDDTTLRAEGLRCAFHGRRVPDVEHDARSGVDRRHLRSIIQVVRDLAAGGAVVGHDDELLAHAADQELCLRPLLSILKRHIPTHSYGDSP